MRQQKANSARWYGRNKALQKARVDKWKAANPEKVRAASLKWQLANPEKYRSAQRKSRGLPEPTRPRPPMCECCGRPPGKRRLALDHCHLTGQFRGWLCHKCNISIGGLGDTIGGLYQAIAYLQKAHES